MMGRIGDDKIEEVRARADIVEIIGAQVRLRRTGRNFTGLCPFHQEKTPSFSVNPERGFFHCFGCGAGGTVFNFIMKTEGLTFPEAVRQVARRYGVEVPESGPAGGPSGSEREALYRANQAAADFYESALWKSAAGAGARAYLEARGISIATARAFKVGFAPGEPVWLARALEKRSLSEAGLKLGLLKRDPAGIHDNFRARVMFPIRDVQGRVIAFGGRVLDDRMPKYLNSPESPLYSKTRTLYGLYEARQAIAARDRAILVEGYVDAIMLWQAGCKEVVAGCGTALTVEQLRMLARHTRNVLACFDGDSAGRKASLRGLEIFLQAGLLGRGIFIPSGFDPDTYVREQGAESFARLADSAGFLIDYFLDEQAAAAGKTDAGRAQAAERVAAVLRMVTNNFEFDLLARKAAPLLGVGEELLRREAHRPAAAQSRGDARPARTSAAAPRARPDAGGRAEIGLIAIALLHPQLRAEIAAAAPEQNYADAELAQALMEVCTRTEPHQALIGWAAERLTAEQQAAIAELAVGGFIETREEAHRLLGDCVVALDERRRRREVESLKRRASASPTSHLKGDRAVTDAQAVISLRRESQTRG
ncbi:MAG TPA: DNA primase [Candidatus Binataceae bacterium]|nr:DNA primase [Candidatus Binataceae bacterium]